MPRPFVQFLDGNNIYTCRRCRCHLTSLSELISKDYRSQHGTAYLFHSIVNVLTGRRERRKMTSGYHTVCDIFCVGCESEESIGWKYIEAEVSSQKFKEGRFILSESCLLQQEWTDD